MVVSLWADTAATKHHEKRRYLLCVVNFQGTGTCRLCQQQQTLSKDQQNIFFFKFKYALQTVAQTEVVVSWRNSLIPLPLTWA